MNAPLPAPTRALIIVSNFTRKGGFLLPFIFVGLIFLAKRIRQKNERFRVFWDDKILMIPVFGKMMTLEVITRFIRNNAQSLIRHSKKNSFCAVMCVFPLNRILRLQIYR